MKLPVTIYRGFSVGLRAVFVAVMTASAGVVFLHTPWGEPYAPDWDALFYRLELAPPEGLEIWGVTIALWMAWWASVPQTAWIVDTDGVRRVIFGFLGRRNTHFPISAISSIRVAEIDYQDRPHYWLIIRLASGKKLKFRIGEDAEEADDLKRALEEAGADRAGA
jgi:hypothetical protein